MSPGRYTFHDLLRAYATEQVHTVDVDQQRHAATHRLLDHYLHTAHGADRLLNPLPMGAAGPPRRVPALRPAGPRPVPGGWPPPRAGTRPQLGRLATRPPRQT